MLFTLSMGPRPISDYPANKQPKNTYLLYLFCPAAPPLCCVDVDGWSIIHVLSPALVHAFQQPHLRENLRITKWREARGVFLKKVGFGPSRVCPRERNIVCQSVVANDYNQEESWFQEYVICSLHSPNPCTWCPTKSKAPSDCWPEECCADATSFLLLIQKVGNKLPIAISCVREGLGRRLFEASTNYLQAWTATSYSKHWSNKWEYLTSD